MFQERDLVKGLNLSHNNLEKIPKKFASSFKTESKQKQGPSLLLLNLSFNALVKLPSNIADVKSLTHIDLSHNSLKAFPAGFLKLDRVRFLSLAENNIPAVPDNISKMVALETLILSKNPLGSKFDIEKGVNKLFLDRLELSSCGMEVFSENLGNLLSLKILDISQNALTSLPDSLGKLQNLEELRLTKNKLDSLPLSLGLLRKLRCLEILDNPWTNDATLTEVLGSSSPHAAVFAASSEEIEQSSNSEHGIKDEMTDTMCRRVQLLQRQRMRENSAMRLLLFEEKDHQQNIEIRFKVKGDPESGFDIVQSTPEKLMLYLTRYQPPEKGFFKVVLQTWTYWATQCDLLELVKIRLVSANTDESNPNAKINTVIRLRTLNFFKKWVESLIETKTIIQDPQVFLRISEVIELLGTTGASAKDSCLALLEELRKTESDLGRIRAEYEEQRAHKTTGASSLNATSAFLLETSPKVLAQQITLLDYEVFKSIPIVEFLHQNWTSKQIPPPAANLLLLIDRFNLTSSWVATELVKVTKDKALRIRVLAHMIGVANELLGLHHFNGVFAVMGGLSSAPISRLKETWAGLPQKPRDIYAKLQNVIETSKNFENYRKLINSATFAIPYMGLVLQDLTFIEDGNQNIIPGTDLINFHKFLMLGEKLQWIETMQQNCPIRPEDQKPDPPVRDYLVHYQTFGEDETYHASLMCEAGQRRRVLTNQGTVLDLKARTDSTGRRLSECGSPIPRLDAIAEPELAPSTSSEKLTPRSRSLTVGDFTPKPRPPDSPHQVRSPLGASSSTTTLDLSESPVSSSGSSSSIPIPEE